MEFIKSLFTRKKPLSSNVRRNNTARANYEYTNQSMNNFNFSNVNPAMRNLKIQRAANALKSQVMSLKQRYNRYSSNSNSYNSSLVSASAKLRNNVRNGLRTLEKVGRPNANAMATLNTLKFEELPLKTATGLAINNSMSVATNDPRKLSGASNISGGRRTRRNTRKSRRNRRRRN
jgi:hypothetical protein